MAIAQCPECQEEVTVPAASHEATVQCPLCDAEYELAVIAETLPPELIVLSDPVAEPEAEDELQLAAVGDDQDGSASHAAFAFDEEGASTRPLSDRAAARRSSGGSPLKTIVQVVMGGALALPLAQLVLWHLPEEPRDPVGLGEKIYQEESLSFLRSIVPEELNFGNSSPDVERAEEDESRPLTNPLQQDTGFDVGPMDEVEMGSGGGAENPFGIDGSADDSQTPTVDEIAAQPKPAGPAPLSPTEYVRESFVFQSVVIDNMFAQAQDSLKQWDELEEDASENLRKIERKELFLSLGQLASGITYQDPDAEESFEAVSQAYKFFMELASREEILMLINKEFELGLSTRQSPRGGVLFTARSVGEEESVSGYQRLIVRLEGTDVELPLVYSPEIAQPVQEEVPVLVLGSLIRRPRRDVKNYLGTDDFVVVFGSTVPLATSSQ